MRGGEAGILAGETVWMAALTRVELDQLVCSDPACTHAVDDHPPLILHSRCHPHDPTWVIYDGVTGELTVECSVCEAVVTVIAVATHQEEIGHDAID